ncbi:MAG: hypothetical protein KJ057_13120 [Phycisphaerae bacterium]|nr:hypothetical protein [Planctomycetia bacterium]MCL4719406.1 hypothetical protein [Phycisphaerae bacterium]
MKNSKTDHVDSIKSQCHSVVTTVAAVVGTATALISQMHEALDCLMADDCEKPSSHNYLVEQGYPFEIAVRCGNNQLEMSVATEIASHQSLSDRLSIALGRVHQVCRNLGLQDELEPVTRLCAPEERKGEVVWLVHCAIMAAADCATLEIYLGPCYDKGLNMTDTDGANEKDQAVWRAVQDLLQAYGLGTEVEQLASIRKQLTLPGRPAPQITFIGIDLGEGRPPRFKVYLNPNVSNANET